MPKCLNDPSKRYTGKENTPRGKGYTASAEKIGKKMKGLDGKMYVVTKLNKTKKWTKLKSSSPLSPMTRRKKYKQEDSSSSEEDEDWKIEAAQDRCSLSNFSCPETIITSIAFLTWDYFKNWYNEVKYGKDPEQAHEEIVMVKN